MEDMTWFTHVQIFDDLLIVAQKETACYIWKTEEELVVIDGIWPDERVYGELLNAIRDAGWEQEPITKFIMTHGHIDHVGCGKWLVDKSNILIRFQYDVVDTSGRKDLNLRTETVIGHHPVCKLKFKTCHDCLLVIKYLKKSASGECCKWRRRCKSKTA